MPYVVTDACLDIMDRTCMDQCPVDCIVAGERMVYIDPDTCIDCGACEPVCPQSAIHLAEALPSELAGFTSVNAEFFLAADFGPASGDRTEPLDHPSVAALPRQASA